MCKNKIHKKIKAYIASVIIIFLIGSPLRIDFFYPITASAEEDDIELEDLFITEDTTWNNQTDLSQYGDIHIEEGSTLTIEKGSQLAFRNIYVHGTIRAIGTMEEKIKLTKIPLIIPQSENYDPVCFIYPTGMIEFSGPGDYDDDPESILEFVEFSQMGSYYPYDPDKNCPGLTRSNPIKNFFFPTAYASAPAKVLPAISMLSGKVTLKNCTFDQNYFQDINVNIEYAESNQEECQNSCDPAEPDYEECMNYCASDVGQNTQSYLHIENSNFQNNSKNTALVSSVINRDKYDATSSEIFHECMDSHNNDYSNYWEFCSNLANSEADNEPGVHNRTKVVLKNNWYGDEGGPKTENNLLASGESLSGDYALDGWSTEEFGIKKEGQSNVFFARHQSQSPI